MTIIIRRDPKAAPFGFGDLFADEPPPMPAAWNGPHVGLRITEGFATLKSMPGSARLGILSAWPAYKYEFDDLVAQAEQHELERTMRKQNSTRVLPSAVAIAHMEASTYWPAQYLGAKPELREAVNMVALAYSLGRDCDRVAKKRGGLAETWRERHDRGCELIAVGLAKDRVTVF